MKLTIDKSNMSIAWYIDDKNVTFKLDHVTAIMPDESTETFDVTWEKRSMTVIEHGHTYPVNRYYGYAMFDMPGYRLKVDLEDLSHKIDIVDYSVRELGAL